MIEARPLPLLVLLVACSSNPPGQTPGEPSTASPGETAAPSTTASPDPTGSADPAGSASAVPTGAPSGEPVAAGPNAERGRKIFEDNSCTACHGTRDKPKKNVYGIRWTDERKIHAANTIKKGKSPMPGYGDKLTDADIADVLAFLGAS